MLNNNSMSDNSMSDNPMSDNPMSDFRLSDYWQLDNRKLDNRKSVSRKSVSRKSDNRKSDNRKSDNRKSDNRKSEINILELIPQQPPFVMVEKLLYCDIEKTKTSLSIKSDNIFVENNILSQSGIIENVAQTCAARMGYLGDRENVRIGMIGSINDFEFSGVLPKIDDEIFTKIIVDTEIGNIVLLNATVFCNEKIVATGKMKVVLTELKVRVK